MFRNKWKTYNYNSIWVDKWCAMYISFRDFINQNVVVYMDDIIIFLKKYFDRL